MLTGAACWLCCCGHPYVRRAQSYGQALPRCKVCYIRHMLLSVSIEVSARRQVQHNCNTGSKDTSLL
jgi:hypothetical protein